MVVQKRPYAVVVGGVNMDIAGYASGEVVPHDSNPGRVEHTAGGVGRNEAHGMRLLGLDVKLVTAFGDDLYAEKLRQNCRDLGIDVKDAITVVNAATSTYLSVVDHRGTRWWASRAWTSMNISPRRCSHSAWGSSTGRTPAW